MSFFFSQKKSSTEERHEHLRWHGREYNLFVIIIIIIIQLYSFNLCLNGKNGKAAVELVTTA